MLTAAAGVLGQDFDGGNPYPSEPSCPRTASQDIDPMTNRAHLAQNRYRYCVDQTSIRNNLPSISTGVTRPGCRRGGSRKRPCLFQIDFFTLQNISSYGHQAG
jgi:hypothetical protein